MTRPYASAIARLRKRDQLKMKLLLFDFDGVLVDSLTFMKKP